jgi:predicted PurR-regulated permease PerM
MFENKVFVGLLAGVTVAFLWVLWPFYGAVFWGAIFAMMFRPLFLRLLKSMPQRNTLAALAALSIVLLLVILPLGLIVASLVQEATGLYQRIQSGELKPAMYLQQVYSALPVWVLNALDRFGLGNQGLILERLTASLSKGSQYMATQAVSIGQNAFDVVVSFFVMLYIMFFLLRDGEKLARHIREAIPLEEGIKQDLLSKFVTVISATVRGNVAVAALQGALGGVALWVLGIHAPVLWGTLMAFLSLLPAVGAALVWGPVGLYLLATGAVVKGVSLLVFGVVVIGLVDNIMRPLLVGKDTKMPDYVVLVSTLGGMAIFGLNGFVIGPLVAAMFMAVWAIFGKARMAEVKPEQLGVAEGDRTVVDAAEVQALPQSEGTIR